MIMKNSAFFSILLSVLLCCSIWETYAQPYIYEGGDPQWGEIRMNDGSTLSFAFDYGGTDFDGFSLEEYCSYEEDFVKELKGAEKRFISEFREQWINSSRLPERNISIKVGPDADYIIKIHPHAFEKNGDFYGDIIVMRADGAILFTLMQTYVKGGVLGSFSNLIGDGYESLSQIIVRAFEKGVRKKKI